MERRVIKINLVGAICVVLLIIAAIVGASIGIPKLINKKNASNDNNASNVAENKNVNQKDSNKEFVESVMDDGEEVKIKMKYYKSRLGYAMNYASELFAIDEYSSNIDKYVSLYSNTIKFNVEKRDDALENILDEIEENDNMYDPEQIKDFNTSNMEINGKKVIKRVVKFSSYVDEIYVIKVNNNLSYIIKTAYGENFGKELKYAIEKMIESFEVV